MTELHDRFVRWIEDGARDQLPRDLALHASGCPSCLARAAAMDALLAVDPGDAPAPPLHAPRARRPRRRVLVPALASIAAVVVVVAAGVVAGTSLAPRLPAAAPSPAAEVTDSARGEVLGGRAGGAITATRTESPQPTSSPSAEASAVQVPGEEATPTPFAAPPSPTQPLPTQLPPGITPAPPTPRPTATPATPTPTPSPSPILTPTPPPPPTPIPTPTPVPDSDGDGVPDDIDQCPSEPAGPMPDPLRPGCPLVP